ncbi:ABC transporter ATP-binding protein [Sinosporangium siamense]|uniref:ABC transporter ATP-binding protein n=1 Tax=Sinosporangium siamense TaxID=1367973 RepID=A0A919RKA5_9ACTN|nr:ABC transporter ATP-binding protein [Sinosporangium siamense]GII95410.1 ABC transporter ATP-binding protein [Sinosporangium siamense]
MTDLSTAPVSTATDLCVENLSIGLGSRPLVRDVSFTIKPGETICLVGESGSGKSLTARAIAGLLPAGLSATGSVRLDGRELIGRPERELRGLRGRRVSLLMQDPFTMLNPMLTAGATIAESLPRSLSRTAKRAEVLRRLAEVGITDPAAADRYPFQLSGGMCQRVAMAAALAKDPDLLIADEPTTALDASVQSEVLSLLMRLRDARGMSLLLITHDLRVAFSTCDRVLVMYAGSVVEEAPAAALAATPAHPYSAGLLTAMPSVHARRAKLVGIPGRVPSAADVAGRCVFEARCRHAVEECRTAAPPLVRIGEGHASACARYEDIRAVLNVAPPVENDTGVAAATTHEKAVAVVTGLGKDYRTRGLRKSATSTALHEVSLSIGAGESVGLVGESGSGKSTLARCLLGLTKPTRGTIAIDGVVQCVFQDPYTSLNPSHTIGFALREALTKRVPGSDPVDVRELLELVGLPSAYAERRPVALSGGERQRVAIARALAVNPALLICDEPVAALDVSVQAQVLELLRRVNRELGTSLLFITHDLAVVRQVTDRLVVLYKGRFVEEGPTGQVLDKPTHEYTQMLLNSVLFEGTESNA